MSDSDRVPTWGELAQRVARLGYLRYRGLRRYWRHRRVARRERFRNHPIGAPLRVRPPSQLDAYQYADVKCVFFD